MHDTLACFLSCYVSALNLVLWCARIAGRGPVFGFVWGLGNLGSAVMTGALVQSATQGH